MSDTIKANMYADNWFMLYFNGELVAVDSISFIPHNVVSVDILPSYPMTIAVMAKDNADPQTGNHDELYDLSVDIGEHNDLAAQRPADARKLRERLDQYLVAVDAQLPTPNPNFDPNQLAEPQKRGGRNKRGKPAKN